MSMVSNRSEDNNMFAPPQPPPKTVAGGKAALLNWCQQILAPYVDVGIIPRVMNFSEAWQSGIAFLCLVHTYKEDLVPELTELSRRYGTSKYRAQQAASILSSRPTSSAEVFRFFSLRSSHSSQASLDAASVHTSSSHDSIAASPRASLSLPGSPPGSPSPSSQSNRPRLSMTSFLYTTNPLDWRTILSKAFALAEQHMGIPQLLDPEDIANVAKPDEMVIMTYVRF